MDKNLTGVMPPMPTPFAGDALALGHFKANLERLLATDLSGFVVLGSNGEASLLDDEEKLGLLKTAREAIPADKWLLAGTGMESTRATCELTKRAGDFGVDIALVLTPSFYRPNVRGLRLHFETVADASPIPVMLYNVPKFTGTNISVQLVAELADHPNIIGIKDSAGDIGQLAELREKTPKEFAIFIGADKTFFAGLTQGMNGGILALSNVAPAECVALFNAVQTGNWSEAQALSARLTPVGRVIVGKYGVPGLKAALDLLGAHGGNLRLPLVDLEQHEKDEIKNVLQKAELLT